MNCSFQRAISLVERQFSVNRSNLLFSTCDTCAKLRYKKNETCVVLCKKEKKNQINSVLNRSLIRFSKFSRFSGSISFKRTIWLNKSIVRIARHQPTQFQPTLDTSQSVNIETLYEQKKKKINRFSPFPLTSYYVKINQ